MKLRHVFAVLFALTLAACATLEGAKPYVKTVDDIAQNLCAKHYGQAVGIDVEEAAQSYCDARDKWAPWIDAVLAAEQMGAAAAAAPPQAVAQAPECPTPAPTPAPTQAAPAPVPAPSVAPSAPAAP